MPKGFDKLMIRQLDDTFDQLAPLRSVGRPRESWLRVIRRGLGMTMEQVSRRLDVTKSMIAKYERAELDETITLGTLRRVASALNSELVYALIPEKPIEQMRRERAEALARRRVQAVHASMVLEDQAVSEGERERQIAELAEALLEDAPRAIWDEV